MFAFTVPALLMQTLLASAAPADVGTNPAMEDLPVVLAEIKATTCAVSSGPNVTIDGDVERTLDTDFVSVEVSATLENDIVLVSETAVRLYVDFDFTVVDEAASSTALSTHLNPPPRKLAVFGWRWMYCHFPPVWVYSHYDYKNKYPTGYFN